MAAGAAALVLILLVVAVNGCLDSRRGSALKHYNSQVSALVEQSNAQGKQFFSLLSAGTRGLGLQDAVNRVRAGAVDLVSQARRLDVPDEMRPAQNNFLTVLEFRRDGLTNIARLLPDAQSAQQAAAAVPQITGQMQYFLASDVVYSQRVVPLIGAALSLNGVGSQTIAPSVFLSNPLRWLDQSQVSNAVGAAGATTTGPNGKPAPGTHGHALDSVSVGATTLQANAANKIPSGANTVFTVKFTNQGTNDEHNVVITISVDSGQGKPITVEKTVPVTTAGQQASVQVPLGQAPPVGTAVTIKLSVGKVPGEKTLSNNTQEFPAIFGG